MNKELYDRQVEHIKKSLQVSYPQKFGPVFTEEELDAASRALALGTLGTTHGYGASTKLEIHSELQTLYQSSAWSSLLSKLPDDHPFKQVMNQQAENQ